MSAAFECVEPVWTSKEAECSPGVKYREIIANNLSKGGWSWGYVSAIDSKGRTIWSAEVEAAVTRLWEQHVQVRTPDKELRWRTMYTVWYPGGSPLARPVKQTADAKANSKAPAKEPITPNGKNGELKPKSVRRTRSRKRR